MAPVRLGPFSLDVPQGWTLSSIVLAGPADAKAESQAADSRAPRPFQRNVIVTLEVVSEDETPDDYLARQEQGLHDAGVESGLVGEPEEVALGGGMWGLLLERILVSDGERVRQMQLVTIKKGVAYTVIASHLDGAPFNAVRNEFQNILTSFQ